MEANFHPHVHVLLTDGAFTEAGEFLQLPCLDARLVEEVFRRRVLQRLHTPPDPRTGLVEKILDPLLCPACGSKMKIVSVITEPNVIDAILRYLAKTGGRNPFEGRAPPAA